MCDQPKTPAELAQAAFEAALPPPGPPLAARVGDAHLCPLLEGTKPHLGGPISKGCPTVNIAGMLAARVGDMLNCAGAPDSIAAGSATVNIGGMPAARFRDSTAHGGMIIAGAATVMIG